MNETGEFLLHYADENSCLILGPDRRTTNPYISSPTRYVLDNMITKNLASPAHLTMCFALNLDHRPVLNDLCPFSFSTHRKAQISGSLTGPTSKLT
jgi:hypothetical protein